MSIELTVLAIIAFSIISFLLILFALYAIIVMFSKWRLTLQSIIAGIFAYYFFVNGMYVFMSMCILVACGCIAIAFYDYDKETTMSVLYFDLLKEYGSHENIREELIKISNKDKSAVISDNLKKFIELHKSI